jgi:hypothetical protein
MSTALHQSFRMPDEPASAAEYARLFRPALTNISHPDHGLCSAEWSALCRQEALVTMGTAADAPMGQYIDSPRPA